jgi:hypothetical protein
MPVPTNYTWTDNEIPNFKTLNDRLYAMFDFLLNPPMVRLRKTVSQNYTTATTVALSWDFVEVENTNMWDAANPTRIKPSVPGWYVGTCGWSFNASSSTGNLRQMDVYKNGVTTTNNSIRHHGQGYANTGWTNVARGIMFMEQFNGTTDYVEMYLYQGSGSTLSTQTNTQESQPDFTLRWMAPL